MKHAICIFILAASMICPLIYIIKSIQFNQNCGGYLEQAANANTVELALDRLDHAVDYIERNNLTSGYTSVLWRTEDENVEFWYKNIKACRDELKIVSENENATHLEKSNVLMKVRESLVNDSESVQVIVPQGISLYPNNLVWGILRLISYIAMLLVIGWACFGDDF